MLYYSALMICCVLPCIATRCCAMRCHVLLGFALHLRGIVCFALPSRAMLRNAAQCAVFCSTILFFAKLCHALQGPVHDHSTRVSQLRAARVPHSCQSGEVTAFPVQFNGFPGPLTLFINTNFIIEVYCRMG